MKRLIPLLVVLVAGCNDAYESNSAYMEKASNRFEPGQSWADVKDVLAELGDEDVELYNPCTEENGDESTPCRGYQLIASIPLPDKHPTAGAATGQVYFSFGPDKVLGEHFYEIYYENHH